MCAYAYREMGVTPVTLVTEPDRISVLWRFFFQNRLDTLPIESNIFPRQ